MRFSGKTALARVCVVIALGIMGSGCGLIKPKPAQTVLPDLPLQTEAAITQTVSAQKGGWIFYNDAYQELAVYFPPGSLSKDTEVVFTPIQRLSVGVSDVMAAGFVVEDKATKKSPVLKKPVALAFKMPDSDPNVMIFKYLPADGAYTPIKSRLISSTGSNVLMAGVTSFSAYGVKKPNAKDEKAISGEREALYKGMLSVSADGAVPLVISTDAGTTTIVSNMTLSAACPEAVIRGGVYKGECAVTADATWTDTASYSLKGRVVVDYLLPSKNTDRPKTLPANLKQKVESRAEGRGYIEFGPDAFPLTLLVNASGTNVPVDFRPSDDGKTWPLKVFLIPGTNDALVVTAFGFYMGRFEFTKTTP